MTAIAAPASTTAVPAPVRALLRVSLIATVLAAAATEAVTAIVRAAGVHLAVGDPGGSADSVVPVDAGACAVSIVLCMLGTAIAALINRRSRRPARTYRLTAGVLVAVSLAAPLSAAATSAATKLTLIATHLIAAAIVVPLVSRRLTSTR